MKKKGLLPSLYKTLDLTNCLIYVEKAGNKVGECLGQFMTVSFNYAIEYLFTKKKKI
jgi:hypothetical protein